MSERTGYVEFVEDSSVAAEFNDIGYYLLAEGVEDSMFFGADVGFALVDF